MLQPHNHNEKSNRIYTHMGGFLHWTALENITFLFVWPSGTGEILDAGNSVFAGFSLSLSLYIHFCFAGNSGARGRLAKNVCVFLFCCCLLLWPVCIYVLLLVYDERTKNYGVLFLDSFSVHVLYAEHGERATELRYVI